MHAIVPSHVGAGNLSSLAAPDLMAAARYHRWRTPESRFFLFAAHSHMAAPPVRLAAASRLASAVSSDNRLPNVRDQFGHLCDQRRL